MAPPPAAVAACDGTARPATCVISGSEWRWRGKPYALACVTTAGFGPRAQARSAGILRSVLALPGRRVEVVGSSGRVSLAVVHYGGSNAARELVRARLAKPFARPGQKKLCERLLRP